MSTVPLVDIGREKVTVPLFDTKGGSVTLYKSLTAGQQSDIAAKFSMNATDAAKFEASFATIVGCFIEWNVGKGGELLECTVENLKAFSQRDVLAMLQACTGVQLLDTEGRMLSEDEVGKKGASA